MRSGALLRRAARSLLARSSTQAHAPSCLASSATISTLRAAEQPAPAALAGLQRMLWSEPWATPLALRHPAQQHWQHNPWLQQQQQQQQQRRAFAAAKGEGAEGDEAAAAAGGGGGGAEEADAAGEGAGEGEAPPSVEHLTAELQERERAVEELQAKVNDLADSFKRSLAEMENLRQRTAREVDTARRFAAEPVIKAMLDVADNLQRAAEAVPAAALDGSEPLDADKARALLASLLEGVRMTEGVLMGAFRRHGVEQYDPAGEKFDPNLHQAMFEVPDATKEAGVVAVVTKRGYKLHDRVLRAAEVGVYKAP